MDYIIEVIVKEKDKDLSSGIDSKVKVTVLENREDDKGNSVKIKGVHTFYSLSDLENLILWHQTESERLTAAKTEILK